MKTNTALNIITGFFAVIFCIIFVLTSVSAALIGTLSSCITPKGITELFTRIDYTELIGAEESEKFFEELGLEEDALNDIVKSDAVEEVLSSVAEGISAGITGDGDYEGLTADDIKNITQSNLDEIITIAKDNSNEEFDESAFRSEFTELIEDSAEEIAEALPSAKEINDELISDIDSESLSVITFLARGNITLIIAVVAAAALVIVCLIRIWNFSGFIFAGVAAVITTVLTALLTVSVHIVIANSADVFGASAVSYINPLLGIIGSELLTCVIITAAAAAVLITAFALLRKFIYNKKQRNAV